MGLYRQFNNEPIFPWDTQNVVLSNENFAVTIDNKQYSLPEKGRIRDDIYLKYTDKKAHFEISMNLDCDFFLVLLTLSNCQ